MDISQMPERVRAVVEEYCRDRCCEAEAAAHARGKAEGREEVLAVIRVVQAVMPGHQAVPPPVPIVMPAPVAAVAVADPKPDPKPAEVAGEMPAFLSVSPQSRPDEEAEEEDEELVGTAGFRDALDDLFGDDRWGHLDRQELVRYVMLLVQEELSRRGVDPAPVLDTVRTFAECGGNGGAWEQSLLSAAADPGLWLSWQAVPLRHPRGDFRFAAENLETGQKRYGDKAIAHMRHANRDRYEFADGERQPYDAPGERTLAEHTEAFRRAKDSLADLVASLRAGEAVRPGDLVDFQDRIGLLAVPDLRTLRRQLSDSLKSRVRAGKTKADRVAGLAESLKHLQSAATAITKAVLARAEESGRQVHPDPATLEVVGEGEIEVPAEDVVAAGAMMSAAPEYAGDAPPVEQVLPAGGIDTEVQAAWDSATAEPPSPARSDNGSLPFGRITIRRPA